ncbi:hypothetical protein TNCV_3856781 [Trichonephila clavipes]|nr:hypothetical protein TNCV_3856781 [Trichonephila clavipes]
MAPQDAFYLPFKFENGIRGHPVYLSRQRMRQHAMVPTARNGTFSRPSFTDFLKEECTNNECRLESTPDSDP